MSDCVGRRGYLAVVGGCLATSGVAGTAAASSSDQVTVSGRVEAFDGDPAGNRELEVAGDYDTRTDDTGDFQVEVDTGRNAHIGFYKSVYGQKIGPVQNGVPHVDKLVTFEVDSSDVDLGTLTLPKGHVVDVQALDGDGNPVADAEFHVWADGYGSGYRLLRANDDGYMTIRHAEFTGIELAESSKVTVTIPGDDGAADKQFEKSLYVDGPTTVTAQEGEGVTVEDGASTTTPSTTSTTGSSTSTRSTATTSSTSTTKPPSSASTTRTTDTGASGASLTTTAGNGTDTAPRRGFLSNGESAGSYGFLRDPFFLTVGGFVLSVAGIAHNMVRGR